VRKDLLTAREVAQRLGVSTETALRWTRRGLLPGFRLPGGAIRYRESEIDAWLEAREVGRGAPGGVSQPGGRAQVEGYGRLHLEVSANPPPDRGDNPGGS
jgi:excisionase family DNA binding protein